jgi:nitronate monooxygenase
MGIMMNRICQLLGIQIPIMQAPSGRIAGPELAAAVSDAGALGGMGVTWTSPSDVIAQIEQIRRATQRPFYVNFVLAFEPRALQACIDARVPAVTFSWGEAGPYVKDLRAAGIKIGIQAVNPLGVRRALEQGADFIVLQGREAGGHVQATMPLYELLAAAAAMRAQAPLVVAGGIATGAQIAQAMKLGADGVLMGTRFVATVESRAHDAYKQALSTAEPKATAMTTCFDGGWPNALHRVLRNRTLEEWEAAGCPPVGRRPREGEDIGQTPEGSKIRLYDDTSPRKGMSGKLGDMALYAGESVQFINDVPPAGALLRSLWTDAQLCLQ